MINYHRDHLKSKVNLSSVIMLVGCWPEKPQNWACDKEDEAQSAGTGRSWQHNAV